MTTKIIRKTFKYRIYPTKAQIVRLEETLSLCCELYNAALQERRDAWKINGKSISYFDQSCQLPDIKKLRPEIADIHSIVLLDALKRVSLAFERFFRRAKSGQKAGYPRFQPFRRYDSITYRQIGNALNGNKLRLSKIGQVKIKLHRLIEGKIKTLTVKRETGRWFATFACEVETRPLPESLEQIGIDVGLLSFATLSDGMEIENPHYYREAQAKLRRAQRKVARRKKGSNRRRKAVLLLQRAHAHVRRQRADFHHKISRWLVNNYGLIAVEDLNVKNMVKNHNLAKSISDAGWSEFMNKIAYKAESAGRDFIKVNPSGTSQTCICGAEVRKTLSVRWHQCDSCGLSANRDHVSAQVILGRAVRLQSSTCSVS
jgi:putative transposase